LGGSVKVELRRKHMKTIKKIMAAIDLSEYFDVLLFPY